jgi:hypothetical protein
MDLDLLRYELEDGFVHNWLVAGPQRISASGLDETAGDVGASQADTVPDDTNSGLNEAPVEHSRFVGHKVKIGDYEGSWTYRRTQEDHLVDFSQVTQTPQILRAWAYTQVDVPTAQDVTLVLATHGPADVWVNDAHVYHHGASERSAAQVSFQVPFVAGHNAVLIRFEQACVDLCTLAVALRVLATPSGRAAAPPKGAAVVIPTAIQPVKRRRELERTFDAAHLSQTVFERFDHISLQFDPVTGRWANGFLLKLQTPEGETFAESEVGERPLEEHGATLGQTFSYPERFYHAVLQPTNEEYANQQMWATRTVPLWALNNNTYSDAVYGELVERRFEALKQAARYPNDVYAEMAKMAVSWWSVVEPPVILRAVERVKARETGSVRQLLALLGILIRYSEAPEFPEELKAPLEEVVLGYRYSEPPTGRDHDVREREADTLLVRVCELLAGQRFADLAFADSEQTGAWHREEGQRQVMAWLSERAAGGYAAWDSDIVFAEVMAALIHLVEFAEDDEIWEMATALLDKTLYSLALNSFKGGFAATRGLTEVPQILHGMLEATSGICRLMWGLGAYNSATMGYVSLACADNYGFPELIQAIATDTDLQGLGAVWSRERHAPAGDETAGVTTAMYRTPDYMLSSAQDYRPGESGSREHIWQATLGPAARVFVNHPTCTSLDRARRPNFWRGNGSLPRVAQWQDVLIAIHDLPEDDWMGFTHAYFPMYAFDASAMRDDAAGRTWAFAQKGSGYLALTAMVEAGTSPGLVLTTTGLHAERELRAYGRRTVWLCHMGRAAQDGSFVDFQDAVLGLEPAFEGLSVRMTTLRGETLAFGSEGPLLRDGKPEPDPEEYPDGLRHFESPYGVAELPAEELIIVYGEQALRLNLK